jgi:hypothetical protein
MTAQVTARSMFLRPTVNLSKILKSTSAYPRSTSQLRESAAPRELSINTSRPMTASTYTKNCPWCLYALRLQDDLLRNGDLFMEDSEREKISTCTYFTRGVLTIWLTSYRRRWGNRDQADKVASRAVSRADAAYGFSQSYATLGMEWTIRVGPSA